MSQSFDLSQFPDLPPEVVKAFVAQSAALEAARFEASVERAARQHEQAVVAEKEAFITELKELIEKLEGQVGQYRQAKFGPKSEKLDPAQLELALEDLETAIAETQAQIAAVEDKIAASATDPDKTAPRAPRKARALPDHLPRVECVIEPASVACPCGCGDMVRIGEDRTERLDFIPARYQVIVTIRPKYACPKGRTGVVQAKAPAHLLEGSWPTEALLAQIAMAKHSEHMPLNRQAVAMARLGVPIERSVLADWMGRTGSLIAPVVDRMAVLLKTGSSRLYVDETTAPVLDPGRGRTKTGYLWAVLRDDRGWNGPASPGVVFHYHPGRKGEYADEILMGFDGTIQVDAYGGYPSDLAHRSSNQIWTRAEGLMQRKGIFVVWLDEFQHLAHGKKFSDMRTILDSLKDLMKRADWPVLPIVSGVHQLADLLNLSPELVALMEPAKFDDIAYADVSLEEVDSIVVQYADLAEMDASAIRDEETYRRMIHATGRRWGRLIELVIQT